MLVNQFFFNLKPLNDLLEVTSNFFGSELC